MTTHYSCLGFPVRTMDDVTRLGKKAARGGERLLLPDGGAMARWRPGANIEVWVHLNAQGNVLAVNPFFTGCPPQTLAVTSLGQDPESAEDAWVEGWINPAEEDEPFSGAFPLYADLADYPLSRPRLTQLPRNVSFRLAAFAHEATTFPDAQAYQAAQSPGYAFPVGSFNSVEHVALGEGEERPEATALIVAEIAAARLLSNPDSNEPFWWLQVAPQRVPLDVVVDPALLRAARAGEIFQGVCWITGRLE